MAREIRTRRQAARLTQRRYSLGRVALAEAHDVLSLLRDFYRVLLGFLVVWVGVGAILAAQRHADLPTTLYDVLRLMAFQSSDALPSHDRFLAVMYFLVPFVAIVLFLPNVLLFGRLVVDKRGRLPSWQVSLAATYRGQVIVCGLGRVGIRVVTRLIATGYDVVVIEQRWEGRFVERALALRVPVIVGDAREAATLRQAGVMRARAVLTAIDGDLVDIEIALAARALRPTLRVVLRAFNEELDRNLEQNFGRDSVFSASALAAPTFAAATVSRGMDYVLPVGAGRHLIGVARVRLAAGTPAETPPKLEERLGVRILEGDIGARRLAAGQAITLVGTLRAVEAARAVCEGLTLPPRPTEPETILVCGLGKVGFRVVLWLAQREPRPRIVVLTSAETRPSFRQTIAALPGVEIIEADARDTETLQRAGITDAAALAALTSNDQANLQIALEARRLNPDVHIVLRVFSDALAEKMTDLFGIHTTYSTSELASATLAASAAVGGIQWAFPVADHLFGANTLRLAAGHPYIGRDLAGLRAREGVLVVWLRRGDQEARLPTLETRLTAGDEITIVGALAALEGASAR
ncbi:MAG TPA: NAD-binding protein [Ktedonobacterales bacterium]